MKKIFLYKLRVLLFIIPVLLSGQKIHVQGIITDTTGQVLAFANIMAKEKNSNTTPQFFIANEHGKFDFYLKGRKSYLIKIYYLGYKTASFEIDSNQIFIQKKIILKPDPQNLDAVELLVRLPVNVKGDSIIYVADSFRSGREWKLKDLLKKLPGMEISKEGEIKVMGKKVSKVLVENKPFFGGNPRTALENIPADAIDQIEAVDDYTDIGFMQRVDDQNKLILNIKLKKGKEKFFFGDITAAAGNREKYMINPHIYYYSPKTQAGFTGYAGNTDKTPVSLKEILYLQNINGAYDPGAALETFKLLSPLFEGNFFDNENKSGAIQWHLDRGKNSISVFGLGLFRQISGYQRQFLLRQSTDYTEINSKSVNRSLHSGVLQANWRHKSSVWNYWDFHHISAINSFKSNAITEGIAEDVTFSMSEATEKKNILIENEAVWYKKFNRHWIIKGTLGYSCSSGNKNDQYVSSYPVYEGIIDWSPSDEYQLKDTFSLETRALQSSLKLYYLITNRFHVYITGLYSHKTEKYFTIALNRTSGASGWNSLKTAGFYSGITGIQQDFTGIVQLKYSTRNFLLRGGWKWTKWEGPFQSRIIHYPFFYLRKKFTKSRAVTIQVDGEPGEISLPTLLPVYYITETRNIKKGNTSLIPATVYRYEINYRDFSLLKKYSLYGGVSYKITFHPVSSQIIYSGPSSIQELFTAPEPVEKWRYYGSIKYFFRDFYLKFHYERLHHRFSRYFNRKALLIRSTTEKFHFKTGLLRWEHLDLNAGIIWQNSIQKTDISAIKSNGYEFYADVSFSLTKQFDVNAEYSFKRLNNLPELYSAQMRLVYKSFNNKWRFFVKGYNLFGSSGIISYFENDVYFENEIRRMPSFWLLGFVRKI